MFKIRQGQRLILASSSPRRRELLSGCGLIFDIVSPDIDERILPDEAPQNLVERLAREKGSCISAKHPDAWIIAADTTVVQDDCILNKPEDREHAARMLSSLQGRWHVVWGGVAIINQSQKIMKVSSYETNVFMQPLGQAEIERYIDTGEPMDKAGSYAIQGIGAALIGEVKGSYTNIVGLNLSAVVDQLKRFGAIEEMQKLKG